MASTIRIFGVWLTALGIASRTAGPGAFVFVFMLLGFFWTIPVLVLLLLTRAIESRLYKSAGPFATPWTGVGVGLLVPVALYALAPNPENAKQALAFLAPLGLGTGILWSLTSIPVLFVRKEGTA
jgi:hypothetical protein